MNQVPVTMNDIQNVVKRLVVAVNPRKIILFGSYARGEETPDSDIDFMVIEDSLDQQGMEMVRLRKTAEELLQGLASIYSYTRQRKPEIRFPVLLCNGLYLKER